MRNFFKKILKVFILIIFFVIFLIAIGSSIGLIIQTKSYNEVNQKYNQIVAENNSSSSEYDNQIKELKNSNEELNKENSKLKSLLDQNNKTGIGEIVGKISGQIIVGDNSISQYQNVCAENINNRNLIYCLTVSSITQAYILQVPVGTYQVYSKAITKDLKSTILNYKAYYTEYIKCLDEKSIEQCDSTKLSKNILNVEVKSNEETLNINPQDWANQ